jgi:elongation factor G
MSTTATRVALDRVRNIGIMAHIDAGKTTTTERILYYTGRTHKMGEVHEGAATMDWMAQEQERGITITVGGTTASGATIASTLSIRPGTWTLRSRWSGACACSTAPVAVFDAVAGVQPQSETVWRQADKYKVPRIAFINKMDRTGADFFASVKSMVDKLGANPVPIQLPIGQEEHHRGVVDLVEMNAITYEDDLGEKFTVGEIPAELAEQANEYHHLLIDAIAEHDDELTETYLTDESLVTPEMIKRALRAGTLADALDARAASAARSRTRACSRCSMRSSTTCRARSTFRPSGPRSEDGVGADARAVARGAVLRRSPSRSCPTPSSASSRTSRVYSGPGQGRRAGAQTRRPARPSGSAASSRCTPTTREEREEIGAGEIAAAVGLKHTTTGDTLAADSAPIVLESMSFPDP